MVVETWLQCSVKILMLLLKLHLLRGSNYIACILLPQSLLLLRGNPQIFCQLHNFLNEHDINQYQK